VDGRRRRRELQDGCSGCEGDVMVETIASLVLVAGVFWKIGYSMGGGCEGEVLMDDKCRCGHDMIDHREGLGCEDCLCEGFQWPEKT
jgi:hypothetical protein